MTDPRPTARPDRGPTEPAAAGGRTATGHTDLAARYGRQGPSRRPLIIGIVGVVALVGLVWLAWAAFVQSTPPVASRLLSFEVTSPTTAAATIQVDRRSTDVEAACRLQAKSSEFSIVGELTVTVPAGGARRQTVHATLTTQREATSVVLVGCTTAGSNRPR